MGKTVLIAILLILIFSSCTTNSFIIGEYRSGRSTFSFKKDSTFTYISRKNGYEYSSGSFKIRNNKLLLNSIIQNNILPLKVVYEPAKELTPICSLHVIVSSNEPIETKYRCNPYINGIPSIFEVPTGSYSFNLNISPVKNIYFEIWKVQDYLISNHATSPVMTEVKAIKEYFNGDIYAYINMNDSLVSYKVFDNVKLKFKNNKIVFKDKGINKFYRME